MYQGSAPLSSVARPALLLLPTPDHLIHTPVPACPQPPPLPLARARARTERIEKESKQDRKKVATRGRSRACRRPSAGYVSVQRRFWLGDATIDRGE
jgi:hypothetical protein